jgi:hypothetical protein
MFHLLCDAVHFHLGLVGDDVRDFEDGVMARSERIVIFRVRALLCRCF